jgi:PKD domain-containing protein
MLVQDARATILPAVTLDGPSPEIVAFGGAAMAEDGTGGVVYLKRQGGIPHVFAARYVGGKWLPPERVDVDETFAASAPRIGAADNGELLVVWATPFATEAGKTVDELLSSTLGPGATHFGPAKIVDPDIRQGTGVSTDLAMSSTGQADVVYRVVEETEGSAASVPELHTGDVVEQVRVAHFGGERWVRLGPMNRDLGLSMRPPTEANAPQIAIGPTGSAVVAWQEPEANGVARIWARRIFGTSVNYVMAASASSFKGVPIEEDADGLSLAFTRLGEAVVAYRQAAAAGSPLPGPRIFLDTLPNGEATSGSQFSGAIIADESVGDGKAAQIGPPSVDIDEKEDLRLLYDSNGSPRVVEGTDRGLTGTVSLGPAFAGAADTPPVSVTNPSGGGVSAWASIDVHGNPAVAVREDYPSGAVQTALVGSSAGGPIGELAVGRSGLGDGLVAFQQGPLGSASIAVAAVTAPPAQFVLNAPKGWIKPAQALVSWTPAPSANGPLTYTVVLDGRRLVTPNGASSLRINSSGLSSGLHHVQVLATDAFGQATLSAPSPLRIDGVPPSVRIARTHGLSLTVSVTDAFSGTSAGATSVSFGDGTSAHGHARLRHRYKHPGVYTIVVHVRDRIGNRGLITRIVSVG